MAEKQSKYKKLNFFLIGFIFLILIQILIPAICRAEDLELQLQVPFTTLQGKMQITGTSAAEYIKAVYAFGSAALVALAIIMVMVGGVQWLISGGEADKINKAKDTIFKSFIGLFIGLFAIYMLSVLSPGTVELKSVGLETLEKNVCCQISDLQFELHDNEQACEQKKGKIVNIAACLENITPDINCADTATVDCGKNYKNTISKENCIGTKCPEAGGHPLVCVEKDEKWSCISCQPVGQPCTQDAECCLNKCTSGTCEDTGKKSSAGDAMWDFCTLDKCKPPLVCSTQYDPDRCTYGRTGMPGQKNSDCNTAEGFTARAEGIQEHCGLKAVWTRCDDSTDCPAGTQCRNPAECEKNKAYYKDTNESDLNKLWKTKDLDEFDQLKSAGYQVYKAFNPDGDIRCEDWCNVGCNNISFKLCLPDNMPCVCSCTNSHECAMSRMPGALTANYCYDNTGWDNYCHPGEKGSPCHKFDSKISPGDKKRSCQIGLYCNTAGWNLCTSGQTGERCDDSSQCHPDYKCCKPNLFALSGTCWPKNEKCPG